MSQQVLEQSGTLPSIAKNAVVAIQWTHCEAETAIYQAELKAGRFVLIIEGTKNEVDRAKALLELSDHQGVTEFAA